MATVRIADEVNKAMKLRASVDLDGRSVTQLVDVAVREWLDRTMPQPAAPPAGQPARAPRPGPARIGRPRARQAAVAAGPRAKCPHPVGRRVGGVCLVCGASVG